MALVGENGAGKSTIVKLLLRLYEPSSGTIFINGIDYREYEIFSLRSRIGATLQQFLQLAMTVGENIGVGNIERLEDREAIRVAAKSAGIAEKVLVLPKQYDTQVGHGIHEDAVELSGGEWQKVALARCLIKNASLLVLDEPTSALDARSEYEFFVELSTRAKNQSLLLISHRFSSVRVADKILVLRDGTIIERGDHDSFVAKEGLYSELFELQTRAVATTPVVRE